MEANTIKCPKCSSAQLFFDKKGFSGKKAVVGAVLTGGIGFLAGTIGSNKVMASCLSCGNKFSPVQVKPKPKPFAVDPSIRNNKIIIPFTKKQWKIRAIVSTFITLVLIFLLLITISVSGFSFLMVVLSLITLLFLSVSRGAYNQFKKAPNQTLADTISK